MPMNQALKGRHRFLADYAKACVALSGLNLNSILKPRVPEPAVRAPPPWALLHRAFSALRIRLSLTRMPFRALFSHSSLPRAYALGCAVSRFQRYGSLFPDAINSIVTGHWRTMQGRPAGRPYRNQLNRFRFEGFEGRSA
jgi:hypothetical protein